VTQNTPAEDPASDDGRKPGQRVFGVVDLLRPNRIAGWAVDRSDSAAIVSVEIWREGSCAAVVRADRLRPDLVSGGVGGGRYGFAADIDPPIEPGFEFTVVAKARTADGAEAVLGRNAPKAEKAGADRRLAERTFEEVSRLKADVAALAGRGSCAEEIGRIQTVLDQIEVVQTRLDASIASLGAKAPDEARTGLWMIAIGAIAITLGALGAGAWSLLFASAAGG